MQCPGCLRAEPANPAHPYKLAFIVRFPRKDDAGL